MAIIFRPLRVIVGCEYSQEVAKAFRKCGHEAYSCDLLPCDGGHPEWHYQQDIFELLKRERFDLAIFHPPCTHLSVSGARWFTEGRKPISLQTDALDFVRKLMDADIKHIALENPISVISSKIRKPDQIIQPWQFGHGEQKATCLWLKNLPKLTHTDIVEGREQRIWKLPPGPDRWKERSRTFPGIAQAMAEQYGEYVMNYANPHNEIFEMSATY